MLRQCCAVAGRGAGAGLLRAPGGRASLGPRHASSGGGPAATGLKVMAGAVLLSGGAVGGAVAYASVDADFRKLLEDTVPGSDQVLELAIGAPEQAAPAPRPSAPSKLKISSPVVVTKAKTEPPPEPIAAPPMPPLEEPTPVAVKAVAVEAVPVEAKSMPVQAKPAKTVDPVETAKPVAVEAVAEPVAVEAVAEPMPIKAEPAKAVEPVETAKPAAVAVEDAPAAPNTVEKLAAPTVDSSVKAPDRSQITPDIENSSLELVLEELCQEMAATVEGAVVGHEVSSEAVIQHIGIMQKVLESNLTKDDAMMPTKDDAAWNEMFEAAVTKSDAFKAAEIKERAALAAIENVIESIAAGRKNRTTSTNPNLLVAEEAANRAIYQLDQAKMKGSAIQGEAKVMEEYRELVEAGRQQFQKEMASIMPDVKLGEKSGKLTEDELNMFITHAYRKVLFLQQELAKQQTLEQERFKRALEKHRVETQLGATEKIESELERQKRDLELEHERRMAAIRDEAEGEMRAQLRRQAAAHSDHLADVLSVQSAELNRKNEHELDEKLAAAASEYLTSLSGLSGTVTGLGEAVAARAASDHASLRAQSLWLACTGLRASLAAGRPQAATWEEKLLPLGQDVSSVLGAAGEDNAFVAAVLGSLSPVAVERGVYTEDCLRERWAGVERVARRVAGVGEQGGSLLSYGLSYLQSVLLVDLSVRAPAEGEQPLDPATLSPTDLVNLARHSLDRGNLARAVQYVTLLHGEPGRVARDWLGEARLTLEAGQAAEALLAHAAAAGVAALPAK